MILSAAYALYLYRRIIFGALVKPSLQTIQDLSAREDRHPGAAGGDHHRAGRLSQAGAGRDHAGSVAKLIQQNKTALAIDRASAPKLASVRCGTGSRAR